LRSRLGVRRNNLISLLDHSMATDGRRGGGDGLGASGRTGLDGCRRRVKNGVSEAPHERFITSLELGLGQVRGAARQSLVRGMGKIFLMAVFLIFWALRSGLV
jgi:hypothetical protein